VFLRVLSLIVIPFLLTLAQQGSAKTDSIVGLWQYTAYIYEGHRQPAPNPDLVLTFEFSIDGISKLKWARNNEPGFCERHAFYLIQNENLYQKNFWINPNNHASCSSDPDMQKDKESFTRFDLIGDEIQLHFDLNGKQFLYILSRIGK
jgi:hypothetical protein